MIHTKVNAPPLHAVGAGVHFQINKLRLEMIVS